MMRRFCAGTLIACSSWAFAAERVGTVTLLEGPAAVVRDATRYALAEGVRFRRGDIIEVSDKGLLEIEFADGAALAMGPGTRLLAVASSRGAFAAGDYYVTRGVLKVSRIKQGADFRFVTPMFALQPAEGTVVLLVGEAESSVFLEGGAARVTEPGVKAQVLAALKSGEFYSRKADQKGAVAGRPTPAFIAALPRVFLDPLPSRLAHYKDREVQPKRVDEVSYAEVEDWLKAPADIRRPLMSRFRPRLSDPAFRSALVTNLKFHPEWDPILFPEKYKPKEPPAGAARAPGAATPGGAR